MEGLFQNSLVDQQDSSQTGRLSVSGGGSNQSITDSTPGADSNRVHEHQGFRFADADSSAASGYRGEISNSVPDLFDNHHLKPVNHAPVPIGSSTPDWFTVVLFLVIAGFTWIRVFYYKILRQLTAAFFSNLVSNQVVRDENILVQRASIMLSFVFYLTASLFVYQVSIFFNWDYPILGSGFTRFMIISLLLAFAYSIKMILLKGLGELFGIDRPVATYIFNIFLINNILGLVLLPFVLLIAYARVGLTGGFIYGGISLVIMAFIYRLLRAFRIWLAMPRVSFFYLFLYFCTLEIAPLVVIFKLARG